MEYTKDMVYDVHYNEVHSVIEDGKGRTSKFFQTIKRHKVMLTTMLLLMAFISIDVVLITSFFNIIAYI